MEAGQLCDDQSAGSILALPRLVFLCETWTTAPGRSINGITAPHLLLKPLSAVSVESDYGLHADFYMSYSNIKYKSRTAQNYKE